MTLSVTTPILYLEITDCYSRRFLQAQRGIPKNLLSLGYPYQLITVLLNGWCNKQNSFYFKDHLLQKKVSVYHLVNKQNKDFWYKNGHANLRIYNITNARCIFNFAYRNGWSSLTESDKQTPEDGHHQAHINLITSFIVICLSRAMCGRAPFLSRKFRILAFQRYFISCLLASQSDVRSFEYHFCINCYVVASTHESWQPEKKTKDSTSLQTVVLNQKLRRMKWMTLMRQKVINELDFLRCLKVY